MGADYYFDMRSNPEKYWGTPGDIAYKLTNRKWLLELDDNEWKDICEAVEEFTKQRKVFDALRKVR